MRHDMRYYCWGDSHDPETDTYVYNMYWGQECSLFEIPRGWVYKNFRKPEIGEYYLTTNLRVVKNNYKRTFPRIIVQKEEKNANRS